MCADCGAKTRLDELVLWVKQHEARGWTVLDVNHGRCEAVLVQAGREKIGCMVALWIGVLADCAVYVQRYVI